MYHYFTVTDYNKRLHWLCFCYRLPTRTHTTYKQHGLTTAPHSSSKHVRGFMEILSQIMEFTCFPPRRLQRDPFPAGDGGAVAHDRRRSPAAKAPPLK